MEIFLNVTQIGLGDVVPEGTVIDPNSFQGTMNPISNGLALVALTTAGIPVAFNFDKRTWFFIIKTEE